MLRAATCTNFVYPTKALFGAVPPQRHIVSSMPSCSVTPHPTSQEYWLTSLCIVQQPIDMFGRGVFQECVP